jgi:hypothetical protein
MVQAAVAENLQQSTRQLARHHSMDPMTMRSLLKGDSGMENHFTVQQQILSSNAQEMRKERCCKFLSKVKDCEPNQVWIFSDEKIFTGDIAISHRKSCYFTDLPVAKPQHPHLSLLQGFSEADGSGSGWQ